MFGEVEQVDTGNFLLLQFSFIHVLFVPVTPSNNQLELKNYDTR